MKTPLILAVATLGLGLLHVPAAEAASTVRCESDGNRERSCRVDTRGGVRLVNQLSRQGCWQGDTWGYDRDRIWVRNGCRAEFRVGDSGGSDAGKVVAGAVVLGVVAAAIASHNRDRDDRNDRDRYYNDYDNHYQDGYGWGGASYTFECTSDDNRYERCDAGRIDRRSRVELVRQTSRSACVYGQTWGVDRGSVWVDRGCRGVFGVYR